MNGHFLSATQQAGWLRKNLLEGGTRCTVLWHLNRARENIMNAGAKGCEVIISGKFKKGQRAKTMKLRDGYMISSSQAAKFFIDKSVNHVALRQGVLGIRVSEYIFGYMFVENMD